MGTEPFSACVGACPGNPLQVASRPDFVDTSATAVTYVGLAVVFGVAVLWARRLRFATRPERRALVPVACSSLLLVPALFTYYFALLVLDVAPATADVLGWLLVAAFLVFPLGFAAALLVADLFAGRALRRLLHDVAGRPELGRWRDELALALDDPSVRIARLDPATGRFFEANGSELARPADGSGTHWVPVGSGGREVAALVVDDALTREPELLDAAAAATQLAVRGIALEDALRVSRGRLRRIGDAQRRRIGRQLHDGAERRLIELRALLGCAGERFARTEDRAVVERLRLELDTVLEELRTVSHGIFPRALARDGVAAALHQASRSAAIPVEIDADGVGRHPEAIEVAVYFCCLEALQNAAKHAGAGARAVVSLGEDDAAVRFSVEDDGAGFDAERVARGFGLVSLADRVAAVGGQLRVESAPGRGTRVTGRIPR
jgi:signal transduction histidine kinase